jgi:hypothetical protein
VAIYRPLPCPSGHRQLPSLPLYWGERKEHSSPWGEGSTLPWCRVLLGSGGNLHLSVFPSLLSRLPGRKSSRGGSRPQGVRDRRYCFLGRGVGGSSPTLCREKTLLLVDNAKSHPTREIFNAKDEFIKVMFLPLFVFWLGGGNALRILWTFGAGIQGYTGLPSRTKPSIPAKTPTGGSPDHYGATRGIAYDMSSQAPSPVRRVVTRSIPERGKVPH